MDLKSSIVEAFSAIDVLLVFIVMLFSLRYPQLIEDINKEDPRKEKIIECKREIKRLINCLMINSLPQTLLLLITGYLFLPLVINVIMNTHFCLWNFDFIITAFMFVVGWIWIFLIWSCILGYKLLKKVLRINAKIKDEKKLKKM